MKTLRKKIRLTICGVLLCTLLLSCGCIRKKYDEYELLQKHWGIEIPRSFKLIYTFDDYDGNIFGERNAIDVFDCTKGNLDFFDDFEQERNADFEETVDGIIASICRYSKDKYDGQYKPCWDENYVWKFLGKNYYDTISGNKFWGYSDCLALIYYPDKLQLVVYECLT